MKLLTPDEFNELQLPSHISGKVIEACRYIFILDMPLNNAAKTCGITDPQGMLDLFDAMAHIIKQFDV